jgi:hypothetical protein
MSISIQRRSPIPVVLLASKSHLYQGMKLSCACYIGRSKHSQCSEDIVARAQVSETGSQTNGTWNWYTAHYEVNVWQLVGLSCSRRYKSAAQWGPKRVLHVWDISWYNNLGHSCKSCCHTSNPRQELCIVTSTWFVDSRNSQWLSQQVRNISIVQQYLHIAYPLASELALG